MPTRTEIEAMLTGPGGAFEVVVEEVRGIPMRVYKSRMRSLREICAQARARGDEQTFLVYGDQRIGFRTFVERSDRVARGLAWRFGVAKGDRVAVLSANNPEWCLTFWGVVDAAAILVGLNGWWKTDEILYGLEDSGAKVLVADAPRLARVLARAGEVPGLEGIVAIDPLDGELAELARRAAVPVVGFSELEAAGEEGSGGARQSGVSPRGSEQEPTPVPDSTRPGVEGSRADGGKSAVGPPDIAGAGFGPEDPLERQIDEDDPAVIFYTSGTTGHPKGAISTHRSMIANLQNTLYAAIAGMLANPGQGMSTTSGQFTSLLTSPLFHVSGCHSGLVVGLAMGLKLVMPVGRFEAEKVMALIEAERVDIWTGVPTMVWRVVDHPNRHRYDLSSVKQVAYGGSPAAPELLRRVQETFPNVRAMGNAYGLTESSSVATVNGGPEYLQRPESVGRPLPVVELRIVDDQGTELPPGQTGEVQVRGPIVMPGYWNKPEATKEAIADGGWLRTGDVGYVDDEGYLYITDRAKDMIIRGGENVYCVEIENRLMEHPAIADAAVVGVPHPTLGEEVKAVVVPEPGASLTEDEVREWVRQALADFKVPAYVEIRRDPLPRNPSGKVLKNVLRGAGEVSFAETEL
jgi:long-chain acyl-CoA synthetase